MSQEAYELLLEANHMFAQGKKEDAIRCYREVLRKNPSPNQRQVAEEQLRELGEMPYGFGNTAKVILRHTPAQQKSHAGKKRKRHQRGNTPPPVSSSNRTESEQESAFWAGGVRRPLSVNPWNTNTQGHPHMPLSRQERILSNLNSMFKGAPGTLDSPTKPAESISPYPKGEVEEDAPVETPEPAVFVEDLPPETPAKDPTVKTPRHSAKVCPPKRRPQETDESFSQRQAQYEIWKKHHAENPHIDFNVAQRLEGEGLSLPQLRKHQRQRLQAFLQKRKQNLRTLQEQNASFQGTRYIEALREQRAALFVWSVDGRGLCGRLVENKIFDWQFKPFDGKRKRVPKLDLEFVCIKKHRVGLERFVRVEPAQKELQERPPAQSNDRALDEATLQRYLEQGEPAAFLCHSGVWMWGRVEWFDPYQMVLQLVSPETHEPSNGNAASSVEVMVFRHAIKKTQTECPKNWGEWQELTSVCK